MSVDQETGNSLNPGPVVYGASTGDAAARLPTLLKETLGAADPQLLTGISIDGFSQFLLEKLLGQGVEAEASEELRTNELLLAYASARGSAQALRVLEQDYFVSVLDGIRSVNSDPAFMDEVLQRMRVRLFVASATEQPRIASYTGRTPLANWLRISALRMAINAQMEAVRVSEPVSSVTIQELVDIDPELRTLRAEAGHHFKSAFGRAVRELTPRQHTILRWYVLDGLNFDEIGELLGVHRVTAFRWISDTKIELLDTTKQVLVEELRLSRAEADSLIRAVERHFDVSLRALLMEQK